MSYSEEDIAIVGVGLKFPGDSVSLDDFFELLLRGRSARTEVPPDRWNKDAFYHPDSNHAGTVRPSVHSILHHYLDKLA